MQAPGYFILQIDGYAKLTPEDVWPEGDAPEEPTIADVAKKLGKDYSDVEHAADMLGILRHRTALRVFRHVCDADGVTVVWGEE